MHMYSCLLWLRLRSNSHLTQFYFTVTDDSTRLKSFDIFDAAATSTSTSNPRLLERDILIESLRCEQERFRQIVENGRLEKEKLLKETEIVQVQLDLAKTEHALKQHLCQSKGINLEMWKVVEEILTFLSSLSRVTENELWAKCVWTKFLGQVTFTAWPDSSQSIHFCMAYCIFPSIKHTSITHTSKLQ